MPKPSSPYHDRPLEAASPAEQAHSASSLPKGKLPSGDEFIRWLHRSMGAAGLVPELLLPTIRELNVDPFGFDSYFFETYYEPILSFFYDQYFRVNVEGAAYLITHRGSLVVANHAGTLPYDALMLKLAIYREHPENIVPRGLAEKFVSRLPFVNLLGSRAGEVLATPENGDALLQRGDTVFVFPEGVKGIGKYIWQRYQLERFGRAGFVELALRNRVPIVPVCIFGAEEANPILYKSSFLRRLTGAPFIPITPQILLLGPLLGMLPLPVKITLRFLEPIELQPDEADYVLASSARIADLADDIRHRMQAELDTLFEQRKGWFR